jgi:hypothetical protein
MLHARHHLLPDIAALAEADAAIQVHQHVVGEGVAGIEIRARLGDAMGDAQPCEIAFLRIGR